MLPVEPVCITVNRHLGPNNSLISLPVPVRQRATEFLVFLFFSRKDLFREQSI
jgi:hypothetical protein